MTTVRRVLLAESLMVGVVLLLNLLFGWGWPLTMLVGLGVVLVPPLVLLVVILVCALDTPGSKR